MASIVSAGTTSSTALNMSADTSGVLQLASNNGTTAVTIDTSQQVGVNRTPSAGGGPLQVGFDSSANAGVRIQTTNASTAGEILNFINSSNTSSGKVIYGASQTSVVYQTTTAGQSTGATLVLNGVAFPATQVASSDANTLDDYEEGTFTPTFSPSSGAWTSYSSTGQYIKVGRAITIFMSLTTTNLGTGSGVFNLSGLPFTTFNPNIGAGNRAAIGLMREDSSAGQINQIYANGNGTTGQASGLGGASASVTPQGNGFVYEISLQYITSS